MERLPIYINASNPAAKNDYSYPSDSPILRGYKVMGKRMWQLNVGSWKIILWWTDAILFEFNFRKIFSIVLS